MAGVFISIRGNDTHQVFERKDDQTLILVSLDDSSKVEITREDFGSSLKGLSYETLVAMGVRVLQKNGKWEIATLNNG